MYKWIVGARLPTLPAALVPVMVGTGAAVGSGVVWWRSSAALIVALALQLGVNFANDYGDGIRGIDGPGRLGPTRLVGSGLATPKEVRRAAILAFGIAAIVGLVVSVLVEPWLIPIGLASIVAGWLYTSGNRPYGYLGLGEIAVFIFFGLVATVGTAYLHGRGITILSVLAGTAVGLLACALLIINNLRDRVVDESLGKLTSAVRLGDRRTRYLYLAVLVGGVTVGTLCSIFRPWSALVVVALFPVARTARIVLAGASGMELIGVLGSTGRIQLLTGVLLAAGLALSG